MNITKTTVHSNPEGEGKLESKKKKKNVGESED